jgi:spore cortex biosynthesis protein YabQ
VQDPLIIEQVQTFALTIGLGVFIGLGYDFLRAVKAFIRFSRVAQFFVDLFFWILMTAVVFVALLSSNWGEVRAYVFIGLGTGGILYTLLISQTFYRLMTRLFSLLIRIVGFFMRPIVWMIKIMRRFAGFIRRVAEAIARVVRNFTTKFKRKKKE